MTDATPLKAALVGCGRMGAFANPRLAETAPPCWLPLSHAEAMAATDGVELVALCDVSREQVDKAGEHLGIAARYTDHNEMLRAEGPHILSVATRTKGRTDIVADAVAAGVRGLHLEKPLALNMADCRHAMDAVRRAGAAVTYGALRRFMAPYRLARDIAASGEIGELLQVQVHLGRTMLLWNHPHSVDLLMYFAGASGAGAVRAAYVQASCDIPAEAVSRDTGSGVVVDCDPMVENAHIMFENGVRGAVTCACGLDVTVAGTLGVVSVLADGHAVELRKRSRPDSPYLLDVTRPDIPQAPSGARRCFEELRTALGGGPAPATGPDDLEAGTAILLSMAWSSLEGGRRVDPAALDEGFTVTGRMGELYP